MNWNCIGRVAAMAMLIAALLVTAGCDMGTYEKRLNQTPAAPPAENS